MLKLCLKLYALIVSLFLISCNTTSYYIVRHAEKELTKDRYD